MYLTKYPRPDAVSEGSENRFGEVCKNVRKNLNKRRQDAKKKGRPIAEQPEKVYS